MMMKTKSIQGVAAAGLAAAIFVFGTGGCEKRGSGSASAAKAPDRAADATYTTRAEVKMVPVKGKATSEFIVRHEAIDNFVDPRTGDVGMNSMEMPFTVKDEKMLEGITIGDKVKMTFGVWYAEMPGQAGKKQIERSVVTVIEKLPAGTELTFGRASPVLGSGKP
jgi:Cu/Ag efflux protein CusF